MIGGHSSWLSIFTWKGRYIQRSGLRVRAEFAGRGAEGRAGYLRGKIAEARRFIGWPVAVIAGMPRDVLGVSMSPLRYHDRFGEGSNLPAPMCSAATCSGQRVRSGGFRRSACLSSTTVFEIVIRTHGPRPPARSWLELRRRQHLQANSAKE